MKHKTPIRARNFPSAQDEAKAVQPHGLYDGPGSAFRMAFTDTDFLLREDLRIHGIRMAPLPPQRRISVIPTT